ncbi:hypothetical protein LINPERPRIM_LOCUS29659 [Linum perenne]
MLGQRPMFEAWIL